jgi:cytochrome c553
MNMGGVLNMKTGVLKLAARVAALALFLPAAAQAGSVEAKLHLCQSCHGLSYQGYGGYLVMPRLAGQTPEYIKSQLQAFVEHKRERGLFINMARTHKVPESMQDELARRLQSVHVRPSGGGPKRLVGTGKNIYLEGIPEKDVAACSSCHGPAGEGQDVNPRLAGQSYRYVVRELTRWKDARGQGTEEGAPKKRPHTITPAEIEAVAAYVSYLP